MERSSKKYLESVLIDRRFLLFFEELFQGKVKQVYTECLEKTNDKTQCEEVYTTMKPKIQRELANYTVCITQCENTEMIECIDQCVELSIENLRKIEFS